MFTHTTVWENGKARELFVSYLRAPDLLLLAIEPVIHNQALESITRQSIDEALKQDILQAIQAQNQRSSPGVLQGMLGISGPLLLKANYALSAVNDFLCSEEAKCIRFIFQRVWDRQEGLFGFIGLFKGLTKVPGYNAKMGISDDGEHPDWSLKIEGHFRAQQFADLLQQTAEIEGLKGKPCKYEEPNGEFDLRFDQGQMDRLKTWCKRQPGFAEFSSEPALTTQVSPAAPRHAIAGVSGASRIHLPRPRHPYPSPMVDIEPAAAGGAAQPKKMLIQLLPCDKHVGYYTRKEKGEMGDNVWLKKKNSRAIAIAFLDDAHNTYRCNRCKNVFTGRDYQIKKLVGYEEHGD